MKEKVSEIEKQKKHINNNRESIINDLMLENGKLNRILKEKNEEVEEMRTNLIKVDLFEKDKIRLENKLNKLELDNQILQREINPEHYKYLANIDCKIGELHVILKSKLIEIEKLKNTYYEIENERVNLE